MADMNFQELPTHGSVLLRTNKGDLKVELWSRECPKACRNFVQLCMEGYYNGCIFHRIIPDFLVQSGDPTGSGSTCESIYGEPFPDEINPRLRYRYRGMLGVANAGKGTNGSQFFITLSAQDGLNGRNTLFGRLVHESVYTLTDIASVEVDRNDRPTSEYPPMILECVVLDNPFPDIVPRTLKPAVSLAPPRKPEPVIKEKIQAKRSKMLSFADEGDEDDDQDLSKGFSSAHDVLHSDRSLSKKSVTVPQMVRAVNVEFDNDITPSTSSILPQPTGRKVGSDTQDEVGQVKSMETEALLAEIERIEKTLRGQKDVQNVQLRKPKKHDELSGKRKRGDDENVVSRLKEWSKNISMSDQQSETETSPDVSKSGWLKGSAGITFPIDSKRAYLLDEERARDLDVFDPLARR